MTTHESSEQPMNEKQIRTELGEVFDQLEALPAHAIAERSKLRDRQALLGLMLRDIEIPGAEDIKDRWSQMAGRRSPQEAEGKPFIASPIDGGPSGGS
jgi:hypothetical protein